MVKNRDGTWRQIASQYRMSAALADALAQREERTIEQATLLARALVALSVAVESWERAKSVSGGGPSA